VPTLAEEGIEGVDASSWWGFVGPAGMPRTAIARLNAEIVGVLLEPELKSAFAAMGIEPSPGSPEAFGAFIGQEAMHWRQAAATLSRD
jgi:tripartite-type tricarboxylate transporter receptor subunit TctC